MNVVPKKYGGISDRVLHESNNLQRKEWLLCHQHPAKSGFP